ncbi:MAG: sigma-70 family RNA polymerase sigma factor [Crocinitomicaceae bacterium]|nr:sigma-70 family RNA polymerase sigma factor [Crocinitomicaceae bacterium]
MTESEKSMNQDVQLLRARDEKFLTESYQKVYPMVESYVVKNSGSKDDAQDIIQDAYYLLYKKVEDTSFEITSQLSTYIFGISKNLWLKKITKKHVDPNAIKAEEEFNDLPDSDYEKLGLLKKLEKALVQLGEPCKTIIEQFYYFKRSMKDIATLMHYTSAENAKNQKYKCFNRLKKLQVKSDNGEGNNAI